MKKHVLIAILLVTSLFMSNSSLFAEIVQSDLSKKSEQSQKCEWYKQPQIYNMGAFSSEDIEKYHITVNGLWNGFIGNISSPFAFGRLLSYAFEGVNYDSDKDYVDAQHAKGVYVPATILTIQGHRSLQQENFDAFASRSFTGKLCPWDTEADSYWMNTLHPGFIEWCINHGKRAIDAEADIIVLDEIQGNSLIPLYQWSSQYTGQPAPGFSNETIEGFRNYLSIKYSDQDLTSVFNIDDIETYDLRTRIASTMNATYFERIQNDPLFADYDIFLEQSNFEAKKQIILSLRNYAESVGKNIVISSNPYTLGTNQPYGFWSKGLLFADLLDMFTFENTYTAFFDKPIPQFHRTKWLAWERLAFAATDAPAVTLIDTNTLTAINENLFPLFGFSNSLGVLCGEAFANKGSFVNYHFPFFNRERNWNQVENIHAFVMENKELYNYDIRPYGDVGILYLYGEGMRNHMNTYLGCAQALAESHIPFEVIFDGDGKYLKTNLTVNDLNDYSSIIVPSVLEITTEQEQIIKDYVFQGGKAIVFDGLSLGFDTKTGEISYGDGLFFIFEENVAKSYFETYEESYQQILKDRVSQYTDSLMNIQPGDRKIIGTPYYQEQNQRIILHLVNYDHIGLFDFIWPHSNIKIQMKQPIFKINSVILKTLDKTDQDLSFEITNETLHFTVPHLKDYALILIE